MVGNQLQHCMKQFFSISKQPFESFLKQIKELKVADQGFRSSDFRCWTFQDVLLKTTERDTTANDVLNLRKMLDRYMDLMQQIVLDSPNSLIKGEAFTTVVDLLIFFGRRNNIVKNPVLAPMVYQVMSSSSSWNLSRCLLASLSECRGFKSRWLVLFTSS